MAAIPRCTKREQVFLSIIQSDGMVCTQCIGATLLKIYFLNLGLLKTQIGGHSLPCPDDMLKVLA